MWKNSWTNTVSLGGMPLESLESLYKRGSLPGLCLLLGQSSCIAPSQTNVSQDLPLVYMHPSVKTDFMAKVSGREIARLATVTFYFLTPWRPLCMCGVSFSPRMRNVWPLDLLTGFNPLLFLPMSSYPPCSGYFLYRRAYQNVDRSLLIKAWPESIVFCPKKYK